MGRRIDPQRDMAIPVDVRDWLAVDCADPDIATRNGGFARPIGEIAAGLVARLAAARTIVREDWSSMIAIGGVQSDGGTATGTTV